MDRAARGSQDLLELAAIVETLSDPVLGKTLDGTIRSWNAGAEQLYGYSADEIVGKKIDILVPAERVAEIEDILERLRRGEAIKQFETIRRRKDGTDVDVSLSINPIRNSSGDIIGASAIQHDISERKRREQVQRFLAEASRLLAANVDHRKTLPKVAALTLQIADWCVIETYDGAGSLTEVAIANRASAKVELMREMRRRYPPDGNDGSLPSRVLRTGKAELIPEVSEGLLKSIAQNSEHLHMLREIGVGSVIVVPMRARERSIGTIMISNGRESRPFAPEDLDLAEDLARRAALAIENATLHASEQEARRRAERSAEQVGRLQAVTAALSGALSPAAVADVLVEQGAVAVGAERRLRSASDTRRAQSRTGGRSRYLQALCPLVREPPIDEFAAGRRRLSHRHGALLRLDLQLSSQRRRSSHETTRQPDTKRSRSSRSVSKLARSA